MSSKIKGKLGPTRKKVVLPLRIKIEILDRLRLGESFASISRSFNINESTVRSIKKSEDKIRNSKASTSLSTKIVRDPAIEKMEAALTLWIEDRSQKNIPLSGVIIREKAKSLYTLFKHNDKHSNGKFLASEGWFKKFKVRQSLHNIQIVGEGTSASTLSATTYSEDFSKLIANGEYKPQQVFNADETALFWKRMPNKTFISESEKFTCGFKSSNDKVTLLLCSNASGDCLIKPLMIYRLLNPRALKNQNKDNLPVFWRANKKAWLTSVDFYDWFQNCFVLEVETYLMKNNLDFKAVLILNNAPGQPRELEVMHPNIKVIFLPPNTATLLQPMDQGIIQAFKLHYIKRTFENILDSMKYDSSINIFECWKNFDIAKCIVNVKESLQELKPSTLKLCWKILWPDLCFYSDDEESMQNEILIENVAEVAKRIGRDGFEKIESEDIRELLESQDEDTTEMDLEEMLNPHSTEDEVPNRTENETFTLKNLSKGLQMASELCDFFIKNDPLMERSLLFKRQIVHATSEYQSVLKELLNVAKQEK